jgi:hypothetical protein
MLSCSAKFPLPVFLLLFLISYALYHAVLCKFHVSGDKVWDDAFQSSFGDKVRNCCNPCCHADFKIRELGCLLSLCLQVERNNFQNLM